MSAALGALEEAAAVAAAERQTPRGTVRLAAPADVGSEVLPDLLVRFVHRYPEVQVQTEFSADLPGLVETGFDLALRNGRVPSDGSLVAVRLQRSVFRLYAAPAELRRAPAPTRSEELADRTCVLFRPNRDGCRWRLHGPTGPVEVTVRGPVSGNDMTFVRRAAIAGAGIALLPELVGALAVRAGELAPVLPDHHGDGESLYLVHPWTRHVPLRVRVLRDFLLAHFPR